MTENMQKTYRQITQTANALQQEEGASTLLIVNDKKENMINIFENFNTDSEEILETLEATIRNLFAVRNVSPRDVVAFQEFVDEVCSNYISGHIACVKAG